MSRISKAYFPNAQAARAGSESHFYTSLFTRDVPLDILPYRSSRSRTDFRIILKEADSDLEQKIVSLLQVGHYPGYHLQEVVDSYVDTTSSYLAHFGEVFMEIVEKEAEGGIEQELDTLPLGKVISLPKWYLQLIPRSDYKKWSLPFVPIPAEKIWHIKLPHELGSPRTHRRMLKRLSKISAPMPEFAQKDNALGGSAKYDYITHHSNKEQAVERLTRRWGSIPSFKQIKGTSEYYYIINRLQFNRAQALLREHLITELNALIKRLGYTNEVIVEGVPISTEIDTAISQLNRGNIGFDEALKVIKIV